MRRPVNVSADHITVQRNESVRQKGDAESRDGTGVFILSVVIITVSTLLALRGGIVIQLLSLISGSIISVIQAAVARCNWTGRDNRLAKIIRRTINAL